MLVPVDRVDRQILSTIQQKIWEALPTAYRRVGRIIASAEIVAKSNLSVAEKRVRLSALDLQLRAITTTIIDRTIPNVTRVEPASTMSGLPSWRSTDAEVATADPAERERFALRESLKRLCRIGLADESLFLGNGTNGSGNGAAH